MSADLSRRLARVALLEPIRSLPPGERRAIADAAEDAEEFAGLPERHQRLLVEAEQEWTRLAVSQRNRAFAS